MDGRLPWVRDPNRRADQVLEKLAALATALVTIGLLLLATLCAGVALLGMAAFNRRDLAA